MRVPRNLGEQSEADAHRHVRHRRGIAVGAADARRFVAEHLELADGAALQLAFADDYAGDRVLALVAGLGSMIQTAFQDKTEFFVIDDLYPQSLSNAARNIEIVVWKLSNNRSRGGELFLLSNEAAGSVVNLSFEREFGKMIASLDILSKIVSDKSGRTLIKVMQSLATAVFLPIK